MRRNQFFTGAWGAAVALALLLAFAGLIVSGETALSRRDRVTEALHPFDGALARVVQDVYRVSADTRGYLLAGDGFEFGAQADQLTGQLEADIRALEAAAGPAGFASQAARIAALALEHAAGSAEARRLQRAGQAEAARNLVVQRTAPALDAFVVEATTLDAQVEIERARLIADVRRVDRTQRYAISASIGLALVSVLFLTMTSIYSQRLAETLQQRDRRIAAIIAGVPGVVWEAWGAPDAASQRVDFVSDYVETMLGYSVADWLNTPNFWLTIVHPDDRDRAIAETRAIYNSGRLGAKAIGAHDFRWVAKDGHSVWVRAFSTVILDAAGRPVGQRGVTFDISEQKLAEQALEGERGRLETMLRTLAYGVCEIDRDGRLLYLNPAGERLLGHTARDLEGKQFHDTVHVSAADGVEVHAEDACIFMRLRSITAPLDVRDTFVRRDGTPFLADVTAAPVRSGGRAVGAVLAFQDVTARQRQEQLKDDYLSFASHELRSPLTAVSAMAQFLARRASSDPTSFGADAREAIETLAEETERMVRMVETFLDLARIESGRLVVERERVDLVELVAAEAELTRRLAPQVELVVDTPVAFPALTDEVRLRQVLRNLLDNAAKHAGATPRVQLRLALDESTARIEVSDDGPGIPAEALPHIFDRLYRASNVQSPGLGAGLFITREIVERLGGTITVTSPPEAGATFTVRLPLTPDSNSDRAGAALASARTSRCLVPALSGCYISAMCTLPTKRFTSPSRYSVAPIPRPTGAT